MVDQVETNLLAVQSKIDEQRQNIQSSRSQAESFSPLPSLTQQQLRSQDINSQARLRQLVQDRTVAKDEALSEISKASASFESQAQPIESEISKVRQDLSKNQQEAADYDSALKAFYSGSPTQVFSLNDNAKEIYNSLVEGQGGNYQTISENRRQLEADIKALSDKGALFYSTAEGIKYTLPEVTLGKSQITIDKAPFKPQGYVTAAPTIWDQYKANIADKGLFTGTLDFIGNKAKGQYDKYAQRQMQEGKEVYQMDATANLLGITSSSSPYFIPVVGEGLLIAQGLESLYTPAGKREREAITQGSDNVFIKAASYAPAALSIGLGGFGLKSRFLSGEVKELNFVNDATQPKTVFEKPSTNARISEPINLQREIRMDAQAKSLRRELGLDRVVNFFNSEIRPIPRRIINEVAADLRPIGNEIRGTINRMYGRYVQSNPLSIGNRNLNPEEINFIKDVKNKYGLVGNKRQPMFPQTREAIRNFYDRITSIRDYGLIGRNPEFVSVRKSQPYGLIGNKGETSREILGFFGRQSRNIGNKISGKLTQKLFPLIRGNKRLNAEELEVFRLGKSPYGLIGNERIVLFPRTRKAFEVFNKRIGRGFDSNKNPYGLIGNEREPIFIKTKSALQDVINNLNNRPRKGLLGEPESYLYEIRKDEPYGLIGNNKEGVIVKGRNNYGLLGEPKPLFERQRKAIKDTASRVSDIISGRINQGRFKFEVVKRAVRPSLSFEKRIATANKKNRINRYIEFGYSEPSSRKIKTVSDISPSNKGIAEEEIAVSSNGQTLSQVPSTSIYEGKGTYEKTQEYALISPQKSQTQNMKVNLLSFSQDSVSFGGNKQELQLLEGLKQSPIQKQKTTQLERIRTSSKDSTSFNILENTKSKDVERIDSGIKSLANVNFRDDILFGQPQKTDRLERQLQKERVKSESKTEILSRPKALLIPVMFKALKKEKTEDNKNIRSLLKKVKGFSVFTRRKGKEIKIAENVSESKAKRIGKKVTRASLARTIILRETGKDVIDLGEDKFDLSPREYRKSKRIPNAFVERNALATRSERIEIISAKRSKGRSMKWF